MCRYQLGMPDQNWEAGHHEAIATMVAVAEKLVRVSPSDRPITHQPLESVRRLRKVEQIENTMARLTAGASIVSTTGDTPMGELVS